MHSVQAYLLCHQSICFHNKVSAKFLVDTQCLQHVEQEALECDVFTYLLTWILVGLE